MTADTDGHLVRYKVALKAYDHVFRFDFSHTEKRCSKEYRNKKRGNRKRSSGPVKID